MPLMVSIEELSESSGAAATGAHNWTTADGGLLVAYCDGVNGQDGSGNTSGDIWVRHADLPGGTLSNVKVTSTTDCSNPRVYQLPNRRILLTYERTYHLSLAELETVWSENGKDGVWTAAYAPFYAGGVDGQAIYERFSDDEGATWNSESQLTTYGECPAYAVSSSGTILRSFLRDSDFPVDPFANAFYFIVTQLQYPGEASPQAKIRHLGPEIPSVSAGILVHATPYGAAWTPDNRWWIHAFLVPRSNLYYSTDDGATFGAMPQTVDGGGHITAGSGFHCGAGQARGLAASPDGSLLLWVYTTDSQDGSTTLPGNVIAQRVFPGDRFDLSHSGGGVEAPYGVLDDTATGLNDGLGSPTAYGEPVSFAQAFEGPRRWIMVGRMFADTDVGVFWSGDDAGTVKKFA